MFQLPWFSLHPSVVAKTCAIHGRICCRSHHHQVSFPVAANGAVLASLTSVFINILLIARAGGQPRLTKILARAFLLVIAFGVLVACL